MSFTFLIWGNIKNKEFSKKALEIPEGKLKSEINKMYAFQGSLLYLSQGDFFKEGILNFEPEPKKNLEDEPGKKFNLSDIPKQIMFKNIGSQNYPVSDISMGENHVIILTKTGVIFSWGDNYYGQLGIGSFFIPYIYNPHIIKLSGVEEILGYKNNSYAIDGKNI
jgi:alpha-tubulin suppressor-like RCC1 family protein